MQFTILIILNVHSVYTKYIYNVLRSSPLSIFRIFPSSQIEILHNVNNIPPLPLQPSPWCPLLHFL